MIKAKRLKSMLGVDFYRLFHTPMFCIFLAIAAIIPAMVSIFIGHDYRCGYVEQLFTTHAKKSDYMISKSLVCAFAMACMCGTYLLGGLAGGIFAGLDFRINVFSLLIAILGKVVMSLGWASLYTFLNVIFRRQFGVSITSCFVLGTGIPVIGAAALLGNSSDQ